MPQTDYTVRPRQLDVRAPKAGIVATVTLAHCTCPDHTWRDKQGVIHFCKHILRVYDRHGRSLRKGKTQFRVSSRSIPYRAPYTVTAMECRRPDGTRCPDQPVGALTLCEHLRAAYADAGFPNPTLAPEALTPPLEPYIKHGKNEVYAFRNDDRGSLTFSVIYLLVSGSKELYITSDQVEALGFALGTPGEFGRRVEKAAAWVERFPREKKLVELLAERLKLPQAV